MKTEMLIRQIESIVNMTAKAEDKVEAIGELIKLYVEDAIDNSVNKYSRRSEESNQSILSAEIERKKQEKKIYMEKWRKGLVGHKRIKRYKHW